MVQGNLKAEIAIRKSLRECGEGNWLGSAGDMCIYGSGQVHWAKELP